MTSLVAASPIRGDQVQEENPLVVRAYSRRRRAVHAQRMRMQVHVDDRRRRRGLHLGPASWREHQGREAHGGHAEARCEKVLPVQKLTLRGSRDYLVAQPNEPASILPRDVPLLLTGNADSITPIAIGIACGQRIW